MKNSNMNKIKIELQHFHGCPNSPILVERVKAAIKDFEQVELREVLIESNEKANELKFRGSPTLLINGEDFENQPEPQNPALSCRYYRNGLPDTEEIRKKISEIISL